MVYENGSQGIKEKVGLTVKQGNLVEDVKVKKEEDTQLVDQQWHNALQL
jgi:hypothetical protein|tara:strand:+ start:83 stop:229 length:147 start_codon:yes stop_codon:yes gene_type:complete